MDTAIPLTHIILSGAFFVLTIVMRWGLAGQFVLLCYNHIPKFRSSKFDEAEVRHFIGETSKKLGVVVLMIALIMIIEPSNSTDALIAGWGAFALVLIGSMTFFGKLDIVKWFRTR